MTGGSAAAGKVRLLEPRDFPFAVSLTDTEHWGFTTADFERCVAIAPDGCFLIETEGERAGILTTAHYADVAWVGNIIIAPAMRGRGLGAAIISHALEYFDGKGARAVRLWAYENTVDLYAKFGFARDGQTSRRWAGFGHEVHDTPPPMAPHNCKVYPLNALTLRDVLPFDRQHFGADRSRVLARVVADSPAGGWLARDARGHIAGFVLSTTSPKGSEVGPWVVNPPDVGWAAPLLLEGVLARLSGHSVEMGIYDARADIQSLLESHGFHPGFRTVRMTRGDASAAAESLDAICAIGSLERG